MSEARYRTRARRQNLPGLYLVPELPTSPVAGPRPYPMETDDRRGIIYAFPIWEISARSGMVILYAADPATGQHILDREGRLQRVGEVPAASMARRDAKPNVVWDYAGQTVRELQVRAGEHAEDKPWEDVIAGPPVILEQGLWDTDQRNGKEIAAIHRLKPRFNYDHNLANPRRIEIWRQVELRHARDEALHRAPWIPLPQRTEVAEQAAERAMVAGGMDGNEPRYPLDLAAAGLTVLWRWIMRWPKPVRMTLLAALLWATGVLGATVGLTRAGWPNLIAAGCALMLCSVLVLVMRGMRPRRRRRRRQRRWRRS